MGEEIVFAVAAAGALVSALFVVLVDNAFKATVALITTLVSVAVIFLLLAAPFVAVIQVIVYAGAIVVLFLFVIAYLGDRPAMGIDDPLPNIQSLAWVLATAVAGLGGLMLSESRLDGLRDKPGPTGDIGGPEAIGRAFIDDYIVPFEATSAILLIAAIAAVLLAKRAVSFEGGR